ncbi:GtrA family protein [Patescibacteria group bacterium]|nr:GtrA family protein [Patescibacteria group bacterium]MBU1674065.1 GtrA family protein [Patescibacteria group bacterium]MBU1963786.1 GtrA family protein [Patescibacteria group bacterium]
MPESLYQKYKPLLGQFIRFALIGILNTGIDYVIYLVLTRYVEWFDENKVVATSIAFIVAATNSYFLNKIWTFRDKSRQVGRQYIKFFAVSLVGFGLNAIIFYFLLRLGLFDIFAKILTTGVVLFWNFLANKFWTFKQKIDTSKKS